MLPAGVCSNSAIRFLPLVFGPGSASEATNSRPDHPRFQESAISHAADWPSSISDNVLDERHDPSNGFAAIEYMTDL
jgi:hypothetical protein